MAAPSRKELEERYAAMSAQEFSALVRADLTEDAQAVYDNEARRRQTPEWLSRQAQHEQELLQHEQELLQHEQKILQQAKEHETKRLYKRSQTVDSIAGLLILGVLILLITTVVAEKETLHQLWGIAEIPLLLAIVAFYVVAIIGILFRTHWGRILGMVVCCGALFNIPFGTIVGLLGLFAFWRGRELFGPNRVKHADLRAEFKRLRQSAKNNSADAKLHAPRVKLNPDRWDWAHVKERIGDRFIYRIYRSVFWAAALRRYRAKLILAR